MVWIPTSAEELEQAAHDGAFEERHDFDAKVALPTNNAELAKDIAAMTTDGGALIYGLGEDESGRPVVPHPIELDGIAQRIDQVAEQAVTGPFKVEIVPLRLAGDEARGYLVVRVPPSPNAPHQVSVRDDRRFYGRSDTGNRRLTEVEIDRLYERRRRGAVDAEALLSTCISASPLGDPDPGVAFLHAFVEPPVREDDLWDRARERAGGEDALTRSIADAVAAATTVDWGGTSLAGATWHRKGADKWSLQSYLASHGDGSNPRAVVVADLSMDGRCYFFCGGAGETVPLNVMPQRSLFVVFEKAIALNLTQFLGAVGRFYELGGFYGHVDVGMAVTGLTGAVSSNQLDPTRGGWAGSYGDASAYRVQQVEARDLWKKPLVVQRALLERLMAALNGADFDPLAGD